MKYSSLLFPAAIASREKAMRSRSSQRGFTLVELMVSLTLGLLLMAALMAVFLNVSRTNAEMVKTNGMVENGRFAIDILREDIEHAGFWGGYTPQFDDFSSRLDPGDAPSLAPDPCLAFSMANWTTPYKDALLGIPVQSYDAVPTGCTGLISSSLKQTNTDVLVVRHAANCLPGTANCEALDNSKVYFQSSFCEAETTADPPLRYVLSNTASDFTLRTRLCIAPTPDNTPSAKRKFISNIYYIRTHAVTAGDGIPTLMRSTFNLVSGVPAHETPAALIEGIEGLRVELGVDAQSRCGTATDYTTAISTATLVHPPPDCTVDAVTPTNNTMPTNRGDGVPETPFVRCATGAGCTNVQLRDVVAVKLYVLARSREPTPGYTDSKVYCLGSTCPAPTATACPAGAAANTLPLLGPFCDGFKRHVFQSTIRLNNVSGRRETP